MIMSARISRPLKKLEKLMKKVEKGEFDIYAEVEGEYEVRHLSKTFNLMISRIRHLMDQIVSEQEQKRKRGEGENLFHFTLEHRYLRRDKS